MAESSRQMEKQFSEYLKGNEAIVAAILSPANNLLSAEAEKVMERAIERSRKRSAARKKVLLAASLVLLLATGFFTLTDTGVAIAREVYRNIVTFFGGEVSQTSEGENPDEIVTDIDKKETETFSSVEEAEGYIDHAIYYFDDPDLKLNYVKVRSLDDYYAASSSYSLPDGREINIHFEIHELNQNEISTSIDNDELQEFTLENGIIMYGGYDKDAVFADGVWGNTVISVVCEHMQWEELEGYLEKLKQY